MLDTAVEEFKINPNVTENEILIKSGVTVAEYYNALAEAEKDVSVVYKRNVSDILIGPYNTVIFSCLKANMNIQYITSVYALLTYLTSYLCKPEHNMGELMRNASKEAYGNDVKSKMRPIGDILATKRECSLHESIKRILSLKYRISGKDVVFVPTGFKKDCVRILKSPQVLAALDPDDPNVYAPNLLDKYQHRPDSLENMCYADFASIYITDSTKDSDPDDIRSYTNASSILLEEESDFRKSVIKLKDNFGKMRKRSRLCVIRWYNITEQKNAEKHFFQRLQLYLPWRNEDELLGDHETYEINYKAVKSQILSNIKNHEPFEDINFEDLPRPYENDTSDEEESQDNEFSIYDPSLIDLDDDSNTESQSHSAAASSVEIISMSNETFYEMCSQMNEKQHYLFNFIMKYAVECRYSERNDTIAPSPFNIFLSGGGGVGKSFLIKLLTEFLRRIFRYLEQLLDKQPSVCVTASTGKAATNINGTTVHSAFQLPIRRAGRSFEYTKAGSERIHVLRNKYKYLKVLIVDEISMLGNETFNHLNLRLQDIMDNKSPFGV